MALNQVNLQGRFTKDPEQKTTTNGKAVCSFSIAVDKRGKDAGTNFIDCVAWEGRGETISKYFKKGSPILITGRLDQQSWRAKDGSNRSKLMVIVDDFNFIGGKETQSTPSEEVGLYEPPVKEQKEEIDLSDVPF